MNSGDREMENKEKLNEGLCPEVNGTNEADMGGEPVEMAAEQATEDTGMGSTPATTKTKGKRIQKPEKKRSVGKIVLSVLLTLVILLGLACGGVLLWLKYGVEAPDIPVVETPPNEQESEPVQGEDPTPQPVHQRRDQVYTCLLFGMDSGYGNTDTIMVATFDVPNKTIGLMSIPRDTIVTQEYQAWNNKVNAAYSRGGEEALEAELEELLGIPIDYYVKIRLSAFRRLVNAVGGVWYNVPFDMNYDDPTQDLHIHLQKGYQLLNGEQAMGLVRYRQNNSHSGYGDVGRVETQQEFMIAMLSQVLENATISTLPDLLDVFLNYVETNASTNDMLYFAKSVLGVDLETAVHTGMLPSAWTSPYMWVKSEEALTMINDLLNPYDLPITEDMVEFIQKDEG